MIFLLLEHRTVTYDLRPVSAYNNDSQKAVEGGEWHFIHFQGSLMALYQI
jgi:hypothetical protein